MSDGIEHIHNFCHTIKVITTDLMKRFPNDPIVYRAHKRIITIIQIDPKLVIDMCGPYLYQYRDKIYSDDVDESSSFFIENEYDTPHEVVVNDLFIFKLPVVESANVLLEVIPATESDASYTKLPAA